MTTGPDARPQPTVPKPLSETAEKLLTQLQNANRAAGITPEDPMMPLLNALASVIRFLDGSIGIAQQSSQRILDALVKGRVLADAETRRFAADLAHKEADVIHRISMSIAQSAEAALTRRIEILDRNTLFSFITILFIVAAACLGGAYWFGYQRASTNIHQTESGLQAAFDNGPGSAAIWLQLMRWNNISGNDEDCINKSYLKHGRRACNMSLWIEGEQPNLTLKSGEHG